MEPPPAELDAIYSGLLVSENSSYVLTQDLRIVRTNQAWAEFALANAGQRVLTDWGPGTCILDATSAPLRGFYRDAFAATRASGARWTFDYECSSPSVLRLFQMIVYPLTNWFVVTNSLRIEAPHVREAFASSVAYEDAQGIVTICAHCRRARRGPRSLNHWDWVPAYLEPGHRISHGLCPPCARYYYP
jgi:hypothetical protein